MKECCKNKIDSKTVGWSNDNEKSTCGLWTEYHSMNRYIYCAYKLC